MKKFYIKPDSFVVKLNVAETITQDVIPVGSGTVPSHEIEGKEVALEDEWFSNGVTDYTEKWFND